MKVLVKGISFYEDRKEVDSATGAKVKKYQVDMYGMEGNGADFQAGIDMKADPVAGVKLRELAEKARGATVVAVFDLVSWKGSTFYKFHGIEGPINK